MLFYLFQRLGRTRAQHVDFGTVDARCRSPRRRGGSEGSETWSHGLAEELHMHPTPSFTRHLNRGAANRWARRNAYEVLWIRDRADWHLRDTLRRPWRGLDHAAGDANSECKNAPWHVKRYRRVDAWVCGLEHLRSECLERTLLEADQCHVLPSPWTTAGSLRPARNAAQPKPPSGLTFPTTRG